jgi:hypothetical protein
VYIERLGTREVLGPETILYQAMTALYMEPLWRARPNDALRDVLAASLATLDAVTDAAGQLDWSHESRAIFVDTQLLMLPSAAAALADVYDITSAGRRRLELVARTLYDRQAHWFVNSVGRQSKGEPATELLQIWAASDLALIVLSARRAEEEEKRSQITPIQGLHR